MPPAMQFDDEEEEHQVRTFSGRAFTDAELGRRFGEGGGAAGDGELMDEAAARRMVAAQRMQEREASRSRSSPRKRRRSSPSSSGEEPPQPGRRFMSDMTAEDMPTAGAPAAAAPPTVAAVPGANVEPGCTVRLTGLKGAAHLNGELGRVERWDPAAGRWEVTLTDGDAKAIKPENLLFEAAAPAVDIAPKSPPQAAPPSVSAASTLGSGAGQVGGLSSAALAGGPPKAAPAQAQRAGPPKTSRRLGTIRYYNGRRKLGRLIPDGGSSDLFIPAQGAPNGSQVPPQPGGLFHGTRVSFAPMALKKELGLENPMNEKNTEVVCMDVRPLPGQIGLSVGVDTNAGRKEKNDDRLAAQDLHELGFIAGIFDGHRGHQCAEFVAKQLPPAILNGYRARVKREPGGLVKLNHGQEANLIASAIVEAFESTDKAFLVAARKKDLKDGSTGIVALVSHGYEVPLVKDTSNLGCAALWPKPKDPAPPPKEERQPGTVPAALGGVAKLFIAWCGDCRAVLLRGRQGLRVSEDHRPNKGSEVSRIKDAGGVVLKDAHGVWRVGPRPDNKFARELQKGKKPDASQMKWFLSTSRAFGDPEFKQPDLIVSAKPDVKVVDLVPEDWAIVMGSDGIYDVLSDQNVADIVWKSMVGQGLDPVKTSKAVVQAALNGGSRDNLTAVVMRLGWSSPPSLDSAPGIGGEHLAPETEASDSLNMFG